MAKYRIIYWKHIPSMVVAQDDGPEVRVPLPPRFQQAIDAYATIEGSIDDEAYSAGWRKGEWQQRDGTPDEVARAVAAAIEAAHPTIPIPDKKTKDR